MAAAASSSILPALRTGHVDAVLAHVRRVAAEEAGGDDNERLSALVFGCCGGGGEDNDNNADALVTALAYACPADVLLPALVAEFPGLRLPPAALAARRFDRGGTLIDYFATTPGVGDADAVVRALVRLGFGRASVA